MKAPAGGAITHSHDSGHLFLQSMVTQATGKQSKIGMHPLLITEVANHTVELSIQPQTMILKVYSQHNHQTPHGLNWLI